MALFTYKVIDATGKEIKGVMESDSINTLRAKFQREGLFVTEIKENKAGAEKMILALLLEGGETVKNIQERLLLEEFRSTTVRDVVGAIFEMHSRGSSINAASLINHLGNNSEAAILVSEAVNISEMLVDRQKALEDCISKIHRDNSI